PRRYLPRRYRPHQRRSLRCHRQRIPWRRSSQTKSPQRPKVTTPIPSAGEMPLAPVAQAAFFLGTFLPARRASDKPMAMACFRLVTFLPEPPLRRVPAFISFIVFSTFLLLALLY